MSRADIGSKLTRVNYGCSPLKGRLAALFQDIRSYVARVHEYVIGSRPRIIATAFISLLVFAACKYALVGVMLYEGMSRPQMRVQDSFTAGLLAGLAGGSR